MVRKMICSFAGVSPAPWTTLAVILALVLGLFASLAFRRVQGSGKQQIQDPMPPEKALQSYLGLRDRALHSVPTKVGSKTSSETMEPRVALMDLSFTTGGTITVVAFADGTTSIYNSSGGHHLGGGQARESIRQAGQNFLAVLHQFQAQMHLTHDFPLPQPGGVDFYLVTDAGIFIANASAAEVGNSTHSLRRLFTAAEEVITQYRLNFP